MSAKERNRREAGAWVGGMFPLPGDGDREGSSHRPEALFWIDAEGVVVRTETGRRDELLARASASLSRAIAQPLTGIPRSPPRVHVESAELAAVIRKSHPQIDVVCGPLPELENFRVGLTEAIAAGQGSAQGYLDAAGSEDVSGFFGAVAALHRAVPWLLLSSGILFQIHAEAVGLRGAVVCLAETRALLVFDSLTDFLRYTAAGEDGSEARELDLPPHMVLDFVTRADVTAELWEEISANGWEIAGSAAIPWFEVFDEARRPTPRTGHALRRMEVIALAAVRFLDAPGPEAFGRPFVVSAHAGNVAATLTRPILESDEAERTPGGALSALADPRFDIGIVRRHALEDRLFHAFVASPEAGSLWGPSLLPVAFDLAAIHVGATIATLSAAELRELVFEIVPRKVSVDASAAAGFIAELTAFYAYLERVHGLPQARACRDVLADDAHLRLTRALSDPGRFGLAKALVMTGSLPSEVRTSGARRPNANAKREKRRASRKARKKNR